MYDYNYGYAEPSQAAGILGVFAAVGGLVMLISSVIGIIMLISQWKIYKKAGKHGWEAIIPIYNIIVLIQIVGLPMWYIVLFLVPIANIYAMFKIYIELAHKFNKSTGFGVATVFFSFICLPILAFGKDNVYNGGNNVSPANNPEPASTYNPLPSFENEASNQNNTMNNTAPMFNQNIDTAVNPIPEPQNVLNNVNNIGSVTPQHVETPSNEIQQDVLLNSTPEVASVQPELNTIPVINPVESQPVNNINTQMNVETTVPVEPTQPVIYNTNLVNPTVENSQTVEAPVVNETPNTQMVNSIQPMNSEPQLNVIPNMGETVNPSMPTQNPGNNSNNTTM